jgi:hypothetical protein
MTEESLKILSMDDVCAIIIKTIDEYNLMEKLEQNDQLKQMRTEIYTMYKVIMEKKVNALPERKTKDNLSTVSPYLIACLPVGFLLVSLLCFFIAKGGSYNPF